MVLPDRYVLITAAKNEEKYIEATIESVLAQTVPPVKWVIVSDASEDGTDEIIRKHARRTGLIHFVRRKQGDSFNFGSKAWALKFGGEKLGSVAYDFIGNVDADITLHTDYYEAVLARFQKNPALGIAGGMLSELHRGRFKKLNYNLNSVAGAVQLFRRTCFVDIGGYVPIPQGGIDAVAEIMARMHGWQVRTFPELEVFHHRTIGTTAGSLLHSRFRYGIRDNIIGTHPLFMVLKCMDRFRQRPVVIGGLLQMLGYFYSIFRGDQRALSPEALRFIRREQVGRMRAALGGR